MNPTQMNLFSSVLHAYTKENEGQLDNNSLYESVANAVGLSQSEAAERLAIGKSGQEHNVFHRKVRWHQQTLKGLGIIKRVDDARGVWQLTKPAAKDLNRIDPTVAVLGFSTNLGIAILGACDSVFSSIDAPITLVVTSPPYPLANARKYGNPTEAEYVDFICRTLEPVVKNLVPGGSICLNVSNDIFVPGTPARSLYRERMVLALHDRLGLHKMDEFIWENNYPPLLPLHSLRVGVRFQVRGASKLRLSPQKRGLFRITCKWTPPISSYFIIVG